MSKDTGISISIHTLRVEGDGNLENFESHLKISIHTLRVEGDGGNSK